MKLRTVDISEHRRVRAELEDEAFIGTRPARIGDGAGAAQDRRDFGRPSHRGREADGGEHRFAAAGKPLLGQRDRGDHPLIGLARGGAEGEDAVLQEHEPLDRWIALEDLGGLLGELEARHDVGDEPHPAAVEIGAALGRVHLVGQAQDCRRVRVVDVFVRQEGVQQRLNRRIGRAGIDQVCALHAHHFLVRQHRAPPQFAQWCKAHGGESCGLDRRHVPAAALDAQHLDLLVEEVLDDGLDRGVAAAVQDELGFAAQEPRGIDAQGEISPNPLLGVTLDQPLGVGIGPQAPHLRTSRHVSAGV